MSSESTTLKSPVRILHQTARSGGTIICRCLASMADVVLLSEIHPLGTRMFNPLQQAQEWYGLLQASDIAAAQNGELDFAAAIELIAERCQASGRILVLRDWNHLDYIGIPFVNAEYRPKLAETLQTRMNLLRHATVRHPLDQWLSLVKNPLFAKQLSKSKYLKGTRRFAEMAASAGFTRYEDFTAGSDSALERICHALDVPFDGSYREKWSNYTNITGDVLPGRAGATDIAHLPRQNIDALVLQEFENRQDYQSSLEILGYRA